MLNVFIVHCNLEPFKENATILTEQSTCCFRLQFFGGVSVTIVFNKEKKNNKS